jgi:hypothetical protein
LIVREPQAAQAVGHRRSVDEEPVSVHPAFSNEPATDALRLLTPPDRAPIDR